MANSSVLVGSSRSGSSFLRKEKRLSKNEGFSSSVVLASVHGCPAANVWVSATLANGKGFSGVLADG